MPGICMHAFMHACWRLLTHPTHPSYPSKSTPQHIHTNRNRLMEHDATNGENFAMGAMAAAATVCVMIPLDTVKTRIVTQVRE